MLDFHAVTETEKKSYANGSIPANTPSTITSHMMSRSVPAEALPIPRIIIIRSMMAKFW